MMIHQEELTDLGLAERIDVDGIGDVEKIGDGRFITTYWAWAKGCDGLWIRTPRLYLVRPLSTVTPNGSFQRRLSQMKDMNRETVLNS